MRQIRLPNLLLRASRTRNWCAREPMAPKASSRKPKGPSSVRPPPKNLAGQLAKADAAKPKGSKDLADRSHLREGYTMIAPAADKRGALVRAQQAAAAAEAAAEAAKAKARAKPEYVAPPAQRLGGDERADADVRRQRVRRVLAEQAQRARARDAGLEQQRADGRAADARKLERAREHAIANEAKAGMADVNPAADSPFTAVDTFTAREVADDLAYHGFDANRREVAGDLAYHGFDADWSSSSSDESSFSDESGDERPPVLVRLSKQKSAPAMTIFSASPRLGRVCDQ